MSSESVEMYLVTIAMLGEKGHTGPVPLSRLAEELSVQSVSANQMVRKLDEEGWVSYQPYKGVELTGEGQEQAQHILRHRRLWEVFFVDKLGLSPTEADALACRMEHVTTDAVAGRLYDYLGAPQVSPGGRAIPSGSPEATVQQGWPLGELNVGQSAEVLRLGADDAAQAFLQAEGLTPGVEVVIEALSSEGAVLLRVGERMLTLSAEMAAAVHAAVPEVKNQHAA